MTVTYDATESRVRTPSARIGAGLAIVVLCACYVVHVFHLAGVAEDAFISYRFARHLAAGHGFAWNIGEPPIEGFTNLLWVLISAAAIRGGLDVLLFTQAIGTICGIAVILLTYRFARRLLRADRLGAFMPCLLLAVSGPLAAWAGSGMETTAFALFVLTSVYSFLTAAERGRPLAFAGTALLLVATSLLRPEGIIVFGLLAGLCVLAVGAGTRTTLTGLLTFTGSFAVMMGLVFLWRYSVFGDFLPNTYYAKTGGTIWQYARGLEYVGYFTVFFVTPLLPLVAIGAWSGGTSGLGRFADPEQWGFWIRGGFPTITVVAMTAAYPAYVVYAGGDYMAMYRFLVPVLPFLYLLLLALLHPALTMLRRSEGSHMGVTGALGFAVLALLIHSTPAEARFFALPKRQHGHYRGVQTERWHVARLSTIGRFFDQYKKAADETLATRAIGAIGWYAQMKIDDLSGLTDRHIARVQVSNLGQGWAGHEKQDLDYSFRRLPTYVEVDRELSPVDIVAAGANRSAMHMADALEAHYRRGDIFSSWIRGNAAFIERHYQLRTVWLEDAENGESGFLVFLERKDR